MNLAWVISQLYEPEQSQDVFGFKDVAPIWGSWSTWRTFQTENVLCHERARCQELLRRNLQQQCNFFLPQQHFADLGRPTGVQLYDGDFKQDTLALEDVIACHLAAATVDIVLLLGFDLSKPEPMEDRLAAHRLRNRLGLPIAAAHRPSF